MIVDTNHDGVPRPTDNFSYATCSDAAWGYGGVYPTALAYEGGPMAVAEMLASECGDNIVSGNLRIGIATEYTTTSSSTTTSTTARRRSAPSHPLRIVGTTDGPHVRLGACGPHRLLSE